jgi:uncharacterized membrane protein
VVDGGVVLEFSTARRLGLWGSLVGLAGYLLSIIPELYAPGLVLMLLGGVLVLVALYGLSKVYGDRSIFWNALLATIAAGLAVILALALIATVALGLLGIVLEIMTGTVGVLVVALGAFIVVFALLTVAAAASALLWYKALATLSDRSGVRLFRWSATLYVISIILFIAGLLLAIVLVGILLLLAGWLVDLVGLILLALGFSKLKPPATQAPPESTKPA